MADRVFQEALMLACRMLADITGDCPFGMELDEAEDICDCEHCKNEEALCFYLWLTEKAKENWK